MRESGLSGTRPLNSEGYCARPGRRLPARLSLRAIMAFYSQLIQHIYIIVLHKGDCKIDGSRLRVCRPLEDLRAPLRLENKQKSCLK